MCVSIINGGISYPMNRGKEPPKNEEKDSMVISAVILSNVTAFSIGHYSLFPSDPKVFLTYKHKVLFYSQLDIDFQLK